MRWGQAACESSRVLWISPAEFKGSPGHGPGRDEVTDSTGFLVLPTGTREAGEPRAGI